MAVDPQGILAVSDLSGLSGDNAKFIAKEIRRIARIIGTLIGQGNICNTGFALFKVVDNLRASAIGYSCCRNNRVIAGENRGNITRFNAGIGCSRKCIAIHGAHSRIGQLKAHSAGRKSHFVNAILCCNFQKHCSVIGYCNIGLRKAQRVGNHYMDNGLSHDLAAADHLNLSLASSAVGHELAVDNAAVDCLVGGIGRNVRCSVGRADTNGGETDAAAGGDILAVGSDDRMVKHIGSRNSRINQQTVTNGALRTVGRMADQLNLVLALGTGQIGCRAAAVKAQQIPQAHFLSQLNGCTIIQTKRTAGALTVTVDQNDLIVRGHAHERAGIPVTLAPVGAATLCAGLLDNAIFHQQLEAADGFLNRAVCVDCSIPVGVVQTAGCGTVLKQGKPGSIQSILIVKTIHTTHDHCAAGFACTAVIISVTINSCNDCIIGNIILGIVGIGMLLDHGSDLLGHLLHTRGGALCIHIGGLNANILIVKICNGNIIINLIAISCSVGRIDCLGNAGRKGGFLAGNRDKQFVRCCCFCGRCRRQNGGNNAEHHCNRKHCRQNSG